MEKVIGSVQKREIHGNIPYKDIHLSERCKNSLRRDCYWIAIWPCSSPGAHSCPMSGESFCEREQLFGLSSNRCSYVHSLFPEVIDPASKKSTAAIPILQSTNPLISLYSVGKDQGGNGGCHSNILLAVQLHCNDPGEKLFVWHRLCPQEGRFLFRRLIKCISYKHLSWKPQWFPV